MAMTEGTNTPRVLVAGCGKLGGAIAGLLTDSATVFGLRRNPDRIPDGIHRLKADLMDRESLEKAVPDNLDVVIYCLTPASYDEQGYQDAYVTGLANLLSVVAAQPLKQLIFISSTSVYSQDDDSWVDETSATQPVRFSGEKILAGERTALESGHPATVVRFSGIYGPSRQRFLDEVIAGRTDPQKPAPFSNRIHEEDAARVVQHLVQLALSGTGLQELYVASDCEPVRLDEVVQWVRRQTPCSEPVEGARKGGRAGSKRCSNQRLLKTGFRFRYPSFREGYRPIIGNR
ncbi:NAD-dependent epimerase/dehydratase family protein [Marinobacter sp. F4206]|uniref:NAD-dependent epimerase/dehydratase family protein n=1 Tax=Marinobacter sp. F4206 TaxID=2861777 RepID=UPI001C601C13|nr:NAD-dependent epimerase/dehydratase family protein [Marinobacter sp. F4206]MBW4935535.1 NAD-dependent epimerase/dehydratase family protein [Marinobacter sp. F4206]